MTENTPAQRRLVAPPPSPIEPPIAPKGMSTPRPIDTAKLPAIVRTTQALAEKTALEIAAYRARGRADPNHHRLGTETLPPPKSVDPRDIAGWDGTAKRSSHGVIA